MRAILEYALLHDWSAKGVRVAAVVSNVPDAAGLAIAAQHGVATAVVPHQNYGNRADFEAALMAILDEFAPDLIVLAGFMRILTADFIRHYESKILNIHPSILPSFKGLHTHQSALTAGVKVHGATVHGVTAELDTGPIVMQSCVPVWPDDTADKLAQRVLQTEHIIYPQVLDWWVNHRLLWTASGITVLPDENGQPANQVWATLSSQHINNN